MGYRQTDRHGIVGPMNFVSTITNRETDFVLTQRILWPRRNDLGQRVTARSMFLADGIRRIPIRMAFFGDDPGLSQRRTPIHSSDAHRIRDHSLHLS
jgi:hypothetical protein